MLRYPRTPHVEGSRQQVGDSDVAMIPFVELEGRHLVVEEKLDGANAAVRFEGRELVLQSRGHVLDGGPRERHFDLFKRWAHAHRDALFSVLGTRYVAYGEWMHARHTIYYDALPHWWLEFDVLDREEDVFLSTARRRALLAGSPIVSVPVLHEGALADRAALEALVRPSRAKSGAWRAALQRAIARSGVRDVERAVRETDPSDLAEGLYIKVEDEARVVARAKWVRGTFLQAVDQSGSHWLSRPIVENALAPGVDPFAHVGAS